MSEVVRREAVDRDTFLAVWMQGVKAGKNIEEVTADLAAAAPESGLDSQDDASISYVTQRATRLRKQIREQAAKDGVKADLPSLKRRSKQGSIDLSQYGLLVEDEADEATDEATDEASDEATAE